MKNEKTISLPKGGIILETSIGGIQLGAPPETIKDSIGMNRDVPAIFIAPKNLFSFKKMANFIDIEFPCYYNFFFKERKITLFCTDEQKTVIQALMNECLFGPETMDLSEEYEGGIHHNAYPDMKKELEFFTYYPRLNRKMELSDLIDFIILKDNQPVVFQSVIFTLKKEMNIIHIQDGGDVAKLAWDIDFQETELKSGEDEEAFIPPDFGVTTLGASHGFDPKGKTSGFIFWINGSGILIDPPVDSATWLLEKNVDPGMIKSVILTHIHGDHDAGVMQKILLEGRVTLYTTPTVYKSFIKKISLLTGMLDVDVMELIDFAPVMVNKPINIYGAYFTFRYRLHSIPTIGFEVSFNGKSIVYTSDHLNDKRFFDKLLTDGYLTEGRYQEFLDFEWNKDLIIHEAGVPPLHTPIDVLLALPEQAKKNIKLVHTEKSRIPVDSGLEIPETGLSNSIILNVPHSVYGESVKILNTVTGLDIFDLTPFAKSPEFLSIARYQEYNKNDYIIRKGEMGKYFYIILAGHADILQNGQRKAILQAGAYFGEYSLLANAATSSDIIAATNMKVIAITKDDFLRFISNTEINAKLRKLADVRKNGSWQVLEANELLKKMTINQKNYLESLLEYTESIAGETIMEPAVTLEFGLIWKSGRGCILNENRETIHELNTGDFVGSPKFVFGHKAQNRYILIKEDSSYFRIEGESLYQFYGKNPRIHLLLRDNEDVLCTLKN